MCSQREEPEREMSSEQEADLRAFYDALMRQLQAEGWERGWAAVKAQILDVVTEVNRHVSGLPAGVSCGASGAGAAVSSDTSASSMRASAASVSSVQDPPVGRARRSSRTGTAQPATTQQASVGDRPGSELGMSCAAAGYAGGGAASSILGSAAGAAGFEFVVSGTGPRAHVLQTVAGQSLLCGRFGQCDCVMGHEERDGVLGENLHIGRVQFIAMRTAGEIAILDCWSKCGTRTVQRGEPGALLLASCPGSRSILLFSPTERFVLEVGEQARVIFNPEAADAVPPPAPPPVSPMKGADCGTAAAGANQWPVAEAARH